MLSLSKRLSNQVINKPIHDLTLLCTTSTIQLLHQFNGQLVYLSAHPISVFIIRKQP